MSRLPIIGGDYDAWGTVLNDFLSVSHNADGTQKYVFNVKDYGAVGDGTTNDAPAIQAAIDAAAAAGGGTVYFPGMIAGGVIYGIAAGLVVEQDITLIGDGTGTTLKAITPFANNTAMVSVDRTPDDIVFGTKIIGLTFDCNSKTGSVGIYMNNSQEFCLIQDVSITFYGNKGIWIENVSDNFSIRRVGVQGNLAGATAAIHLDSCPGYMLLEELSVGGMNSLAKALWLETCALVEVRSSFFDGPSVVTGIYADRTPVLMQSVSGGSSGVTNLIETTASSTAWCLVNGIKQNATHHVVDGVNARTYDDQYIPFMAFGDYKYANWAGMTVTNPVTNRTLDVSAATLGDVRQVLGTLITDLKTIGLIDAT